MASAVQSVVVYQINGDFPLVTPITIAFPTSQCLIRDCSISPNRLLATGVSVYGSLQFGKDLYYSVLTQAQLVTLFNT